jgi:hypothetical protein
VALRSALDLAQLGRPRGEKRAAEGSEIFVGVERDLQPKDGSSRIVVDHLR